MKTGRVVLWVGLGLAALYLLRYSTDARGDTSPLTEDDYVPLPGGFDGAAEPLAQRGSDPVGDAVTAGAGFFTNPIGSVLGQLWDNFMTPRGERNNNPGNIERTNERWQGMAEEQTDPRFVVFESPEYGVRALGKLLRNYVAAGHDTVRKIITRYAPSHENETDAYVSNVAASLGVSPEDPLDLDNDQTLSALIAAVVRQENGPATLARYAQAGYIDAGIALI